MGSIWDSDMLLFDVTMASPLVEEIAEIHSEEKENLSENVEEVEEDVEELQEEVGEDEEVEEELHEEEAEVDMRLQGQIKSALVQEREPTRKLHSEMINIFLKLFDAVLINVPIHEGYIPCLININVYMI